MARHKHCNGKSIYSDSQLRGILWHGSEVKAIGEKRHGTRVGDLLVTTHLYSGRRKKTGNMVIMKPQAPLPRDPLPPNGSQTVALLGEQIYGPTGDISRASYNKSLSNFTAPAYTEIEI